MTVNLKRINDGVLFEAENGEQNCIKIDGNKEAGGTGEGFRPMELLLAGIGACSAIDVVLFIKKQRQKLEDVAGELEKEGFQAIPGD